MATEVDDYRPVARFLEQIRRQVCFAPQPDAPPELVDDIPYLGLSVLTGGCVSLQAMQNSDSLHVFTSGLTEVEAVLAFAPEPEFDADLRAVVAAQAGDTLLRKPVKM